MAKSASRYSIELTPAAERALKKIDAPHRKRIAEAIDTLADTPRPAGAKALKGAPSLLRIRVGDYRIVYTVQDGVLTVVVVTIGHRKDVYAALKRRSGVQSTLRRR